MSDAVTSAKIALRKAAATQRKFAFDDKPDAAYRLSVHADLLCTSFAPKILAAYWPIRTELDPIPLVRAMMQRGVRACLPITPQEGLPLHFHEWQDDDALEDGPYGTKQPAASAEELVPDVILAPMLAFDRQGWRLGYGGGFYDRTLAHLEGKGEKVIVIGVAFDEQEVAQVPTGEFDRPLSAIITPTQLLSAASIK